MPICPRCNATIHTGAEDQCPVCGYSLERANQMFHTDEVVFTRVLDEAGALTHQERQELLRALEDLERNVPPIALCIYITAHGKAQEFRPLAHWILNHAHIHHPSFGKREKMQAIEDAAFAERISGDTTEPGKRKQRVQDGWWHKLRKTLRDLLHPYPPPVRQEWMLMLVLDVQLEVACFSWGYMLDPYINPDSINSCIIGARLQFRERAMAVGLKRVMKAAVSQIAAQSHRVNRRLRRPNQMLGLALCGLALATTPTAAAAPAAHEAAAAAAVAASPWEDEDVAEEVEDDTPPAPPQGEAPPPAAPAPPPGNAAAKPTTGAASYNQAPRWDEADYRHLLSGELGGCYRLLATPGQPRQAPATEQAARNRQPAESDAKIPKHYYKDYAVAAPSGLIDPQRLFSNVERADVEHILNELNASAPYRLYIAIHRQGQETPLDLAVGTLVRTVAQPGEYAVMLMYGTGDTPQIELGAHELQLTDADRHAWLEKMRQAAVEQGGGVEGLLAAMNTLHTSLAPLVKDLPPLTQQTAVNIPLIPIQMREEDVAEEVSFKDELRSIVENPALRPVVTAMGIVLGAGLLVLLILWLRRRSGKLLQTEPDVRLASPYGAGLSRNVRYLEGREVRKTPRPI